MVRKSPAAKNVHSASKEDGGRLLTAPRTFSIQAGHSLTGPDKVGKQASAACRHRPQFVGTGRKEKRREKRKKGGKRKKKEKKRKERGKKEKKEEE